LASLIENFYKFEKSRRRTTRHDKTDTSFQAMIDLAAPVISL